MAVRAVVHYTYFDRDCFDLWIFAFSGLTLLVGRQEGIRPVKTEWWGAGVVVCLERGADLCKDPRVQPPLSSKFACKKTHINSIRASLSICVSFRPFVPKELDMNPTSLKVGIHRHCSINKLN